MENLEISRNFKIVGYRLGKSKKNPKKVLESSGNFYSEYRCFVFVVLNRELVVCILTPFFLKSLYISHK